MNKNKSFWLWVLIGVTAIAVFIFLNAEDIKHRIMIASTRANIDKPAIIPFQLARGLIVVQAELEGAPLAMILDSGDFETRLSAETASNLGVVSRINDDVGDTFGRSANMGITTLPKFTLGEATWQRATAGILKWGSGALTPCVAKDGIIGGTTMQHASWVIDFDSKQIHIGHPNRLPESFKSELELTSIPLLSSGVSLSPKLSIEVNGQTLKNILLDTGSNGGLVLPRALLNDLNIPEDLWIRVEDNASTGIHGVTKVSAVLAPVSLKIGDTSTQKVYALFTDDSSPKLGTKVLSNFQIAIVPGERKLYLAKTSDDSDSLTPSLQHGFIPGISEDGQAWVVVYRERSWLDAQSNAADPLAIDSRFTKINGLKPDEVFKDRCTWFLGVRDFINSPRLVLERSNGSLLNLDANHH